MALVHAYQLTVSPHLLSMVQKVQNMDLSADLNSLRVKEAGQSGILLFAPLLLPSLLVLSLPPHPPSLLTRPLTLSISLVYNAVGLCAFQLYDDLDYDTWYQTHLLKELTIRDPRYAPIAAKVLQDNQESYSLYPSVRAVW